MTKFNKKYVLQNFLDFVVKISEVHLIIDYTELHSVNRIKCKSVINVRLALKNLIVL